MKDIPVRLARFIRENTVPIIAEWEDFAHTLVATDPHMGSLSLRDHIGPILEFIINDIESAQSEGEQLLKSHGEKLAKPYPSAAEIHASLRYDGGFNMDQMVSEYRALRSSITKLWRASGPKLSIEDIDDLTRFNETIDQALIESIRDYTQKLDLSRNLFLGILSHDLRNPLGAISMSAQLTIRMGSLSERQTMLQSQITDCTDRASEIVNNLLDLTRTRLGSGLPIVCEPMDMGFIVNQLVDEMRTLHPKPDFRLELDGDLKGDWDKARIGQVLSNLLGNAVQYGFRSSPITLSVQGMATEVVIVVHNEGVPIPPPVLTTIFSALTRAQSNEDIKSKPIATNLGLGLFITREIVAAHGGTIGVASSESEGTAFTVHFPRVHEPETVKPLSLAQHRRASVTHSANSL